MMRILFLSIVICLVFSLECRADGARIRVEGVTSIFVSVATPEIEKSRTVQKSVDSSVIEVRIDSVIPDALYCIGFNNKVCLFSLVPGGDITVVQRDGRFIFSGDGEERNKYFSAWSDKLFYSLPNVLVNNYMAEVFCERFLEVGPEILCDETYIVRLRNLFNQCLRDLKSSGLDKRLIRLQQDRMERMYQDALASIFRTIQYNQWEMPPSLLKAIDRMSFRDTEYMLGQDGRVLTYTFLQVQQELQHFKFDLGNFIARKARCIPNGVVRSDYVLRELGRLTANKEFLYLPEAFTTCKPLVKNREEKARLEEIHQRARKGMAADSLNGVGAGDFEFEDTSGKIVSSEDLLGKYLYIDIWATWCGPCKQEMPYMQELEKIYKGGNISFVSLSVDRLKERDKWLAYVEKNDIEGVVLIAPDAFKTPFIQKYGVSGIPRFMLVAPDGKMISHNCWRPSDPRMKMLLESLPKN